MDRLHVTSRLPWAHVLASATAASAGKDTDVPCTAVQSVLCSGKKSRRHMKALPLARAAAGLAQTCPCVADSFLFHLASWPWSAAFILKELQRAAKAGKGGKLAVVAAAEILRGPGCG